MTQSNNTKTFPDDTNWRDINGFILSLTETPAYTPRGAFEQFVMVTAGGSSRAYLYDTTAKAWRSVVIA